MTPEETARDMFRRLNISEHAREEIAAAITAAVKAEREECAKISDEIAHKWESQPDDDCASIACGDIAAAIRERTP